SMKKYWDISPSRKSPVQMASVGTVSRRVEQASASPASTHNANNTSSDAGTSRQSTPVANACASTFLLKKLITTNASVNVNTRPRQASETNGRRRKKLLNPP